jgi:hypothetical protein
MKVNTEDYKKITIIKNDNDTHKVILEKDIIKDGRIIGNSETTLSEVSGKFEMEITI